MLCYAMCLSFRTQLSNSYAFRVGLFHGLKEVAVTERLPGLYRGIGPTLLAIAPFMAVQQSSYDVLKKKAMDHNMEPSAPLFFVCGSLAGVFAQTVSGPILIKHVHDMRFTKVVREGEAEC